MYAAVMLQFSTVFPPPLFPTQDRIEAFDEAEGKLKVSLAASTLRIFFPLFKYLEQSVLRAYWVSIQ